MAGATSSAADRAPWAARRGAVQRTRKKAAHDLGELEPDDEVKAEYDAYLAALDEELRLVDRIVKKAEARDRSGLQDIKQLPPLERQSSAAAEKAGLSSCAA